MFEAGQLVSNAIQAVYGSGWVIALTCLLYALYGLYKSSVSQETAPNGRVIRKYRLPFTSSVRSHSTRDSKKCWIRHFKTPRHKLKHKRLFASLYNVQDTVFGLFLILTGLFMTGQGTKLLVARQFSGDSIGYMSIMLGGAIGIALGVWFVVSRHKRNPFTDDEGLN